jgi:hypothetical protein
VFADHFFWEPKPMIRYLALAICLSFAGAAEAQWYTQSQGSGPPFVYNGADQFSWGGGRQSEPSYYSPPPLPSVPQIESYIPAPGNGPVGYPCTMPYCR